MNNTCAIILTYNRLADLEVCVHAVLSQTAKPQAIYIIDNASSDDVLSAIERMDVPADVQVKYRRLAENQGASRGFEYGMRAAYEDRFQWMWVMDDDSVPDPKALEVLSSFTDRELEIVNSLVVDIQSRKKLAFKLTGFPGVDDVDQIRTKGELLTGNFNPFNGTLISRTVFDKIAFPKPEFFIWGEEVDFAHRARRAKIAFATATHSVHYHPINKKSDRFLPYGFSIKYVENPRYNYIYIRNMAYIIRTHRGRLRCIPLLVNHLFFEVFYNRSLTRSLDVIKAVFDGYFLFRARIDANGASAWPFALSHQVELGNCVKPASPTPSNVGISLA